MIVYRFGEKFVKVSLDLLGQVRRSQFFQYRIHPGRRVMIFFHEAADLANKAQIRFRVSLSSSIALRPEAVMLKSLFRLPPLSADAPPMRDLTKPFSSSLWSTA